MVTTEDVRIKFYYDPVKDVLLDIETCRPIDYVLSGGKRCVDIDGELVSAEDVKNLYAGTKVGKRYLNGVSYHKASGRWRLTLTMNRKRRSYGYYPTPQEALYARKLIAGY